MKKINVIIVSKYAFPELIIVKDLNDEDPFKMAVDKYKDILNNITDESGLFKLLLLFDLGSTGIINEWDFNNFEILNLIYNKSHDILKSTKSSFKEFKSKFNEIKLNEEDKKLTFPILSMLTLKQVKNHSLELLPKFFFKIPNYYDYNAISKASYRISFFNEERILRITDAKQQKIEVDPKSCVLPLMIEILHENFSLLKFRYLI